MEGHTVTTNIPPNVRDLNRQFVNAVRALTHPACYPTHNSVTAPKKTHVLLRRGRVGVVYEKNKQGYKRFSFRFDSPVHSYRFLRVHSLSIFVDCL